MPATASTGSLHRAHEETVRLRPGDLPVRPLPSTIGRNETVRMRSADLLTKKLPKAISAFDGKTVRMRPIDLPVVGNVAKTVRQRYADLSKILGVAFFLVAYAVGIDRWKSVYAVLASVAFAVFPTWAGLMATVALLPRGEEMMFQLNVATVTITLVGHLICGLVLGFAFLKAPAGGPIATGRGQR
jgi:VIT1/CCC1 family predicted Fe2+/Mn2+ transporter